MASQKTIATLAGALAVLLSAVPAAAAKPVTADPAAGAAVPGGQPRLAVSGIGRPPKLSSAGERIELRGRLRNRGRRGARSAVKLIVSGERAAGRRVARRPAIRVGAGDTRRFRLRFQVPRKLAPAAGEPAAGYPLAACVRRHGAGSRFRCRRTKRPLTVRARPVPPAPPGYQPGARTIGDPLFPQVGNGGYEVDHYAIELDYDPARNRFRRSTRTRIIATAGEDLSELSLDFQGLDVAAVRVDGRAAGFAQVEAKPRLAGATQPMKLIVEPAGGIRSGEQFTLAVRYGGTPVELVDPDGSTEGWVRACAGPPRAPRCDGSFVVNEPNGAQGWFPANNHPSDKATFATAITAPSSHTAIGVGELASRTPNGDGTTTWTWREDDPTATYLTTATVGALRYAESRLRKAGAARTIPVYEAVDADATAIQRNRIAAALGRSEGMINFLAGVYGSYPFDSAGAVVDRVPALGYALEVQTRPHFATLEVDVDTLLHEWVHQWFGNKVSPATWEEIWFNEGWAEWSTWYWANEANGDARAPADRFDAHYANASAEDWSVPPATLSGDPANLFSHFPTYVRSAMTLEAYRQIVGDATFFELARELQRRWAYSDVSTAEVVDLAKQLSGFEGADLDRLDRFFRQWLYGDVKPTILPASF